MLFFEQIWVDFKKGLAIIKGWDREQWMKLMPIFGVGLVLMGWFVFSNVRDIRQLDDRPLYQSVPAGKLVVNVAPTLVREDSATTNANDFVADDDYKFFNKELARVAKILANRGADDADYGTAKESFETAFENLNYTLSEDATAKGKVFSTTLNQVIGDTATGTVIVEYTGDNTSLVTASWAIIFTRQEQGQPWRIDSIENSEESADS